MALDGNAPQRLRAQAAQGGRHRARRGVCLRRPGPLKDANISLSAIFGFTAIIAATMPPSRRDHALLSFFVTRRRPVPAESETASSHKIAIGLTGEPVPVGSRSGAMTHRNDQRPAAAHARASPVNCR